MDPYQPQSQLFRLPPEIRQQIYRDLLISSNPVHGLLTHELAILRACHGTYAESLEIFYKHNSFWISGSSKFLQLRTVGEGCAHHLRNATLVFPGKDSVWYNTIKQSCLGTYLPHPHVPRTSPFALLAQCTQLHLTLRIGFVDLALLARKGDVLRDLQGVTEERVAIAEMAERCEKHAEDYPGRRREWKVVREMELGAYRDVMRNVKRQLMERCSSSCQRHRGGRRTPSSEFAISIKTLGCCIYGLRDADS